MNLTAEFIEKRMAEHKAWADSIYSPKILIHQVEKPSFCPECEKPALFGGYCEIHAKERL